ncbi:oligopeptide/dipeptide ABC transporter ATP-binding protein [Anaerococcus degeneri]|uniref:ATP-binding cassette domain-containing protein n=1 Tax=Anaerococcus degeneri TaxID=361500 RepID=A0ABS7YX63_9FIRM|nr:oligopeptide/dipeptide ABC transporter ATP-binding protein [Anaerococcus degeneri]MBP2016369.1 peptide/nickel transport system ATP-binding protein [Anaerococcus degeneri]MCA2096321.1 ATP-binding cassette domain-containing protein [Anaerococcus degeneri]
MENKDKKVLFKIRNLKKYFPLKKKGFFNKGPGEYVHANESISIDIYEGETLGLVGESGCGKSTFGRTLLQIYEQTEGTTLYYGKTLEELAPEYMGKMIGKIPSKFPNYHKELEELNKIYEDLEKSETDEDRAMNNEKAMFKRRAIEEEYLNMIRIAGGLLASDDLGKVANLLNGEYQVLKERAKVYTAIEEFEQKSQMMVRTWDDYYKILDEDPKYKELKNKADEITKRVEEKRVEIEAYRDTLRVKEGFDELESQLDTGIDLSELNKEEMRQLRKDLQMIFQDPYGSLDTKMTVGNIIGEGVLGHDLFKSRNEKGYNEYIQETMEKCGLAPYFLHRYPHQFSGGQRQRIGIARALALKPSFIVCDEAVSALDVSIQSQIINLLQDLKEQNNLTYLFITHDLSVVKYISDRIGVMYLGVMVELTDSEKIFENPLHPYTKALLQAIPRTDVDQGQELAIIEGDIPSAVRPPKGCRFHTRCEYAMDICAHFEPELKDVGDGHFVACHLMDVSEEEKERAHAKVMAERAKLDKELEEISAI